MSAISIYPIAYISTPFDQKFGIPRQSQALSKARGKITFSENINPQNACRGLEQFSHLWLSFVFHENMDAAYSDTVRPPRLGGNKKIGVFASRSTFRPNPLGLSLVKNKGLNSQGELLVQGVDLLDQTPIVDIKPYIAYADQPEFITKSAHDSTAVFSGYAEDKPDVKAVFIDNMVGESLKLIDKQIPDFSALLINVLQQDPRPAYKRKQSDNKTYHISLYKHDIAWVVEQNSIRVLKISMTKS
ncbi:tRNA (N6-threonylcarbamoyladenosine(37)-N6)-methyltransferase TrmO [Glaciecola sp. MH2013]|uniref:tRNA (N6-threonylcarbamoyladenosine(37)-N6)-methyltransferase TrmO n=1 Tax=Glaciecola sp. MH2013 TaxID=2785524 RepID=UPI00189C94E9|nr:tRNA (N6-threonylcarbamoyladenosine(37)-N6)-methyltransferase TrmO [Glaciecola sp. MH2013]MBF7074765.1 tRNA (N6-threonylcarbamoyladenosine(37)-N6)-methyltransferase TrmO [Glaciecola sp. MH2013]